VDEHNSPIYVDGTVCAVPSDKKADYIAFATQVADLFLRQGAIEVVDNWGDDVPEGKVNSLRSAVLCEPGETVVFSWMTWPSKAVRDAAWDVLIAERRFAHDLRRL